MSEILKVAREMARDLHEVGAMDDVTFHVSGLPYADDCPDCAMVRLYWERIRQMEDAAHRQHKGDRPLLVSITINAVDVPTCKRHLDED